MNLYNKYILPKVTHRICSLGPTMKQRQKVVPLASGEVLEIGVGTGLNFHFYDSIKVKHIYGLEPSEEMWDIAQKEFNQKTIPIDFIKAYADNIPLESHSIDSVIITYTLCSIPETLSSLNEIRRVLKPTGQFIFCEHGKAPDKSVEKWQNRLNPIWKALGGGCHLNRDIPKIIKQGGFQISKVDTMYIPGFKPACFNYWGVARPIL